MSRSEAALGTVQPPLAEPPMNVELIRKPRKPRWDEETRDES